ncbi:MAG: AI-2E family transporter [Candidatus Marinimicrobia bacterium]|nr:AI-2E family transporter [Candidatus Neomarinimicrobiota bacterium]
MNDSSLKIYRLLLLVLIGGIAWTVLPFFASVLVMLIFSFLFTTIFLPSVDSLERKIHSRSFSVIVIIGGTIVGFIWFLGSFATNIGAQIKQFSTKIQQDDFALSLEGLSNKAQTILPDFLTNLIPESDEIIEKSQESLSGLFQNMLSFLSATGSLVFIAVMTLIFTIILLVEYHDFKRTLVRFIPNKYLEVGLRLIYNIEQQISKYLRGQLMAAGSVALLSIIGLFILNQFGANMTLIVFIGIIAGFANLIPMVGPFVGMVPAILVALMNNLGSDIALAHQLFGVIPSPFYILDIIFMFIVVQQIDNNLITPILVGESVGLHPMIVMIVLLIGGTLMGPLGMLFAVPAAGVIKVILHEIQFISKNSHLL